MAEPPTGASHATAAVVPGQRHARHAWLPVLVVGVALFVLTERTLTGTHNVNLVPSVLLLGALVLPATFLVYLYGRGVVPGVPLPVLALSGFVGGVVGTVVAGFLEYDTLRDLGVLPMLGVGLIEESAKLAVCGVVLLVTPYRSRADGLLVGVAVGTGFAVLETMGYGFTQLIRSGGNISAVEELLLLRGVLSPAGHAAWTGLAATALWHASAGRWRPRALTLLAATFVLVVVLHGLWDSFGSIPVYAVLGLVSLGLLLAVARADR